MPHWAAISRWVRGGRAFRPYRRVMIMASRSSRHRLTHRRTLAQESRASSSSSILSSTLMVSISDRELPSPSPSMESDRETSPCSFRWARKCIRLSFSIQREA